MKLFRIPPAIPGGNAFTLIEVLISVGLLAIISVSISHAFLFLNRTAARSRIGTAALIAAQQEIDEAMAARPYTSASNIPQILRVQSEGGALDAGESWANSTTVIRPVGLMIGAAKGTPLVQGMLLRKITVVNPNLRQVDVVVGYNFRGGSNSSTYSYTSQTAFEAAYRYQVRSSTFRSPDE